ncbi:drug/metabolite transporter, DME family [Marininema mesophilum]|uniref:Drug/metabolite transporter, DME family n=1 Tax=Marininema mesophilum TaxID=1048340 RepID=A0A1H2YNJ8_9BACL|nr:EamA family transporter [Marininema mesophilum]SDX06214.1 drug/metabolite transporter, DME family [Marininema mesophilum]
MRNGLALICMAAVMWGTTGIIGKWLISNFQMEPLAVGAWRLLFAAPLMLTINRFTRSSEKAVQPLNPSQKGLLLLFGIALAGYQISYFSAVDRTMVSTATLVTICMAPIWVHLCARFFLRESWSGKTAISLVIGVFGVTFLIGINSLKGLSNIDFLSGNILSLVASCCYAGYTLAGKKLLDRVEPLRIIAGAFTVGAFLMLPFLKFPGPQLEVWAVLLFLGWVPTTFAYIIYIKGLKQTKATQASVAVLLEPLTATVLAVTFIGERLNSLGWIGVILLLVSLLLLSTNKKENPPFTPLDGEV